MSTKLYFIRHAESDFAVKDDRTRPLSPKGRRDAQKLRQVFQHIPIDVVYSSPYARAMETVQGLAAFHKKAVIPCENFRERAIGAWVDDFGAYAQQQWHDFDYALESGESLRTVQNRNIAEVHRLLRQHENATIVVGTHGTALGTICNYYDKQFGFDQFWQMVNIMPYIVKMVFEKDILKSIEEVR